jgi:hypothetical protein
MQSYLEAAPNLNSEPAPVRPAAPAMSVLPVFGSVPQPAATGGGGNVVAMPSATASSFRCEPRVEAIEANGMIQKIVVTCGCGERIEVHCGY